MTLGLPGNALIVLGLWKLGQKNRRAFVYTAIGEILWAMRAIIQRDWELAAICVLFTALAVRNFILWRQKAS